MHLSSCIAATLSAWTLASTVNAVDITNYEEYNCDVNERLMGCPVQPPGVCCEFPGVLTATWSVGFQGLGEGDIATWFHGTNINNIRRYCGNIRRNQVMMGGTSGQICMSADPAQPLTIESNDGANWQRGATKNSQPRVILADSKFGIMRDTFNGFPLVNPVGGSKKSRGLIAKDNSVEAKCFARRSASVYAFDKRDNGTGVWILEGNPEAHKRYEDISVQYPTKSAAEVVELAGGAYYEDWADHPSARALKRGEPTPESSRRSLLDMINSGELERNSATLKLAADERRDKLATEKLATRTLEKIPPDTAQDNTPDSPPRTSARDASNQNTADDNVLDSVPWISTRDTNTQDVAEDDVLDSFPWISARDTNTQDVAEDDVPDSFSWISARDTNTQDVAEDDVPDSFPWISARDTNTQDVAEGDVLDSFPWISARDASNQNVADDDVPDSFPWIGAREIEP